MARITTTANMTVGTTNAISMDTTNMMMTNTTVMTNMTCVNAMTTMIAPEDCDFISKTALVFVIVSIILIILGLFTNIVLLIIIFTNGQQLRTVPNLFIGNMAFLGILFLIIVSGGNIVIFGQVAFQIEIVNSDSTNDAIFFVQVFVSLASFAVLVALGFDRYLSIVHPLRSRAYRTKKRTIIANCLVWVVAGLCMIPVLLSGGGRNIFENYRFPAYRNSMIIFAVVAFFIPVLALSLMYIAILKVIWFNPVSKKLQGEEQERRWKQRLQVFRSIFRVVFSFILHYGYFFAIFLWLALGGHTAVSARLSNALFYSSILTVYLNTAINPLIYALFQQAFRPFVYKLLCPKRFHFRKPSKDALYTTQQINEGVPTATSSTSRKAQSQGTQDDVLAVSNGQGSTEPTLNGNIAVDNCSHHGCLYEGYHGYGHIETVSGTSSMKSKHAVDIQLHEIEPDV